MALTEEQARVKAAYETVKDVFPSAGEAEALPRSSPQPPGRLSRQAA